MRILIGGSPCTHWSIAQTKNRETEASGVGWELFLNYRIARDKYKPDFFLYENNKSMSPAIRAQITAELGVEPVLINSALVSAQNRQRLYWVGKRNPDGTYSQVPVEQPEDLGIFVRDILETRHPRCEKGYALTTDVEDTRAFCVAQRGRYTEEGGKTEQHIEPRADGKTNTLTTVGKDNMICVPVRVGTIKNEAKNRDHDSQQYRVYSPDAKAVTLCGNGGGVGAKTGLYATPVGAAWRGREKGTAFEMRDDQKSNAVTATGHQSRIVIEEAPVAGRMVGRRINEQGHRDDYNEAIPHIQRFEVNEDPQKTNCLTTVQKDNMIAVPMRVREATKQGYVDIAPGECVDLAMPGSKTRRGRAMREKSNCLTTSCEMYEYCGTLDMPIYQVRDGRITIKGKEYPIKLRDGCYIIRKLTVLECMRLQTVPETYTFPVSDSQAYKMLGNGWTVDVIAHIMRHFDGLTAEPVDVLSMYDGMSCGHIALDKLGVDVHRYCATEIDKFATRTTLHNYPDTVQLGDAFQVRDENWNLG